MPIFSAFQLADVTTISPLNNLVILPAQNAPSYSTSVSTFNVLFLWLNIYLLQNNKRTLGFLITI